MSVDKGKALDKIQHSCMIKKTQQTADRREFP